MTLDDLKKKQNEERTLKVYALQTFTRSYQPKPLTPIQLALYLVKLKEFSIVEITRAMQQIIKDSAEAGELPLPEPEELRLKVQAALTKGKHGIERKFGKTAIQPIQEAAKNLFPTQAGETVEEHCERLAKEAWPEPKPKCYRCGDTGYLTLYECFRKTAAYSSNPKHDNRVPNAPVFVRRYDDIDFSEKDCPSTVGSAYYRTLARCPCEAGLQHSNAIPIYHEPPNTVRDFSEPTRQVEPTPPSTPQLEPEPQPIQQEFVIGTT